MSKAGNALMLGAIFITQYVTEPKLVLIGVFVLGLIFYLLDR